VNIRSSSQCLLVGDSEVQGVGIDAAARRCHRDFGGVASSQHAKELSNISSLAPKVARSQLLVHASVQWP